MIHAILYVYVCRYIDVVPISTQAKTIQTQSHPYRNIARIQPLKSLCDIMELPFALWLAYYFQTAVILTSQSTSKSRHGRGFQHRHTYP